MGAVDGVDSGTVLTGRMAQLAEVIHFFVEKTRGTIRNAGSVSSEPSVGKAGGTVEESRSVAGFAAVFATTTESWCGFVVSWRTGRLTRGVIV